ncbi:hypothetical protein [Streptomyces anulatus]|uniref:hypothetical protein n=1 Tax=Streptomyces anulatus TaxID=1892 RepID=UPI00225AD554|nr:hypothetical protein [Streptomyces anulatus]MCX4504299.1 hypothetical protein [Streptomyces anulatus]
MISARLRYTAVSLLALAFLVSGLLWAQAGIWPGALMCLALTCGCLLGCARIRRTAERRQEEQELELALLIPDTWAEPWDDWCCERGFITRGDLHHPTRCTTAVGP